jgi:hypothetical protein
MWTRKNAVVLGRGGDGDAQCGPGDARETACGRRQAEAFVTIGLEELEVDEIDFQQPLRANHGLPQDIRREQQGRINESDQYQNTKQHSKLISHHNYRPVE